MALFLSSGVRASRFTLLGGTHLLLFEEFWIDVEYELVDCGPDPVLIPLLMLEQVEGREVSSPFPPEHREAATAPVTLWPSVVSKKFEKCGKKRFPFSWKQSNKKKGLWK